jgi:thioredoxin-like negative regulator of GroEL
MVGGSNNNPPPPSSPTPPNQVIDLTGPQFMDEHNKAPIMCAFFADGCGHCKNMKQNYHDAAKKSKIPLYTLYAHRDGAQDVLSMLQIRGFPTIGKVYKGKIISTYQGDRSSDSLAAFANNQ